MTTYTVLVQEVDEAVKFLVKNHYDLAVATEVVDGSGSKAVNTIYQGRSVANNMIIAWTTNYGVNWTTDIPAPGAQVTYSGNWQSCALGEAYTLVDGGLWEINTADRKEGYMTVRNAYDAVSIIIGVQDPDTATWSPIYFSPSLLTAKGIGNWQPRQNVQIWFGFEQHTGNVIARQQTAVENYDMNNAKDQKFKHWFQWTQTDDTWTDKNSPYSSGDKGPNPFPQIRYILFTIAVTGAVLEAWRRDFIRRMGIRSWSVNISGGAGGVEYQLTIEKKPPPPGEGDETAPEDEINKAIEATLKEEVDDGTLPRGEKWKIT